MYTTRSQPSVYVEIVTQSCTGVLSSQEVKRSLRSLLGPPDKVFQGPSKAQPQQILKVTSTSLCPRATQWLSRALEFYFLTVG